MKDTLYLAWRYLAHHRIKTAILVGSLTLITFLPVGLNVIVGQSAKELTARAEATPLLVGAKGSPLELALNSLYFESDTPALTTYSEAVRIEESGLAQPIPLYVRFRSREYPIVGTTLEYFDFRGLEIASGRSMAVLGECVLGSRVAVKLGVGPGDTVVSSPESVFDLAGVYPLKMQVVGVLEPSYTADDGAIFVDLKTTWVIKGLVHGHQDMDAPEAAAGVLKREGDTITANASVVQYNEITPDNVDSFHFHGGMDGYPISAIIAVPHDQKSGTILMGRYEADDDISQIVQPATVMNELLGTILTIREFVVAALILVAIATLATAALVFLLSLRLRRREIDTMSKIGGSRLSIGSLLVSEIVAVLIAGVLLAGLLTVFTAQFGEGLIRALLLG
ncbi:MAG: ABC transporter permease [Thermoanaerobaculia bacterium]